MRAAQGYVSRLDEVAGTFAWAAPELLMGGRCSEKVDIYSFGVVLWELATCERPQRGRMRDLQCARPHPPTQPVLLQWRTPWRCTPGPKPCPAMACVRRTPAAVWQLERGCDQRPARGTAVWVTYRADCSEGFATHESGRGVVRAVLRNGGQGTHMHPVMPCRVPEEVPAEVAALMNECLDYNPAKRPSAKQIYDLLAASTAAELAAQQLAQAAQQAKPGQAAPGSGAPEPDADACAVGGDSGGAADRQQLPTPLGQVALPVKSPFAN